MRSSFTFCSSFVIVFLIIVFNNLVIPRIMYKILKPLTLLLLFQPLSLILFVPYIIHLIL